MSERPTPSRQTDLVASIDRSASSYIGSPQSNSAKQAPVAPGPSNLARSAADGQTQFQHQSTNIPDVQMQWRKWQARRLQSIPATTPHLNNLYQQIVSPHNGTMTVSAQPQTHKRAHSSSHSLEATFWHALSKLEPTLQREIFKELREGGEDAYTNARNFNGNANSGQLPSPGVWGAATQAASNYASSPTMVVPQQTVHPARPLPSARADQSVFGSLIPSNFTTHPRFVPFQVTEYSNRFIDKCKPYLQEDSTSSVPSQDRMSKFRKPIDTRSAEEMLRPFASGVGRLVGGLVGADLLDREASAFVQAIQSLQKNQESAEARAVKAEEKVAKLERQMYVIQGLLQSGNAGGLPDGALPNTSAKEVSKLHHQIQILYRHQKDLETKINEMVNQPSKAGGSNGGPLESVQVIQPVQLGEQQTQEHDRQSDETTMNERSRSQSLAQLEVEQIGDSNAPKSGNQGLLKQIATELERTCEETSTLPTADSGVALSTIKAEDEPDELLSGREDTPLTSQSPPAQSPAGNSGWFRRFGLVRTASAAAEAASASTETSKQAKDLKRKRPAVTEVSFITIDSSDDEA